MDIEVLRRAPLFATLDDEAFRLLTDELTEVDLSRGASVFREGDQGDQLYFIVSGKVKLGRTSPDGRESLLAILGPGELFGEMALFDPEPAYGHGHGRLRDPSGRPEEREPERPSAHPP